MDGAGENAAGCLKGVWNEEVKQLSCASGPLLAGHERGVYDTVTVLLNVHRENELCNSRVQQLWRQSGWKQFGNPLQQGGETRKRASPISELCLQPLNALLLGEGEDDLGNALRHDVDGGQGDVAPLDLKNVL